ncbi:GDP-mannose 4,6-dehydratase [Amylibacter sp.]|nr:GDP-mannose 4,6-dehydratase [Amylibacter sp.]
MKKVLVTGSAGFIGFHVCKRLLNDGFEVIGVDSLSDYYDVFLKKARLSLLKQNINFKEINGKIEQKGFLLNIFQNLNPDYVIHLAAQAGVRYSIENPRSYLDSNVLGTFEIIEASRHFPPKHMLIASTSSAYGANTIMPYNEIDKADHQVSFYAATKKSTENFAHAYSHLFNIPITMFRFFTVYGPWGRPDMAPYKFTKSILDGNKIDVYNNGKMKRDFTYIDDLVEGIILLLDVVPSTRINNLHVEDSLSPVAPWRLVNIGNSKPIALIDFIKATEDALGIVAEKNFMPMQLGDVKATWADISLIKCLTGYEPKVGIKKGMVEFVKWYKKYNKID